MSSQFENAHMQIGLGTTVLTHDVASNTPAGIGSYTQALWRALEKDPDCIVLPCKLKHYPLQAALNAASGLPFKLPKDFLKKIDLFHATDHYIPKLKKPVIATIHDAIHLAHPEWYPARYYSLKKILWKKSATWADHIITVSEYSKSEIIKFFEIPENKITVIPQGVDVSYFEKIDPSLKIEIKNHLHLPEHFYLFIGTLQPRKNLERLILAHEALPLDLQKTVPLIIVGQAGWRCGNLIERLAASKNNTVRWLGTVSELEKKVLLQTASTLVFPSLCEGFGLPVLEAFASHLPVITSSRSSLPEVAGDAAILINPTDVAALSEAMQKIITDEPLRNQLTEKGLARAREFSWERCAKETKAVYQRVIN